MNKLLLSLLCATLVGCSADERLPLGEPLPSSLNTWTWVDFPDSFCDDGSTTGIALSGGSSNNLLVFFNGGGACWDYLTCYGLNTAAHGPFGRAEFEQMSNGDRAGSIFDRNAAENPFRDYTFVFVPYCTGDVHAGDNVVDYTDGNVIKTHHHTGHANARAFVKRLAATWPTPGKLVVSGSSAGGFGAAFNYDLFRSYWPENKVKDVYLIDDSGPPLVGDAIPGDYRDAWVRQWRLDLILDPICGAECRDDFSLAIPKIAARYPSDRMALLSSRQDQTIRTYFQLSPGDFSSELQKMATMRIDPIAHFRYFFVNGKSHTMLGHIGDFAQRDESLWHWLFQEVYDDPAWKSLQPED